MDIYGDATWTYEERGKNSMDIICIALKILKVSGCPWFIARVDSTKDSTRDRTFCKHFRQMHR